MQLWSFIKLVIQKFHDELWKHLFWGSKVTSHKNSASVGFALLWVLASSYFRFILDLVLLSHFLFTICLQLYFYSYTTFRGTQWPIICWCADKKLLDSINCERGPFTVAYLDNSWSCPVVLWQQLFSCLIYSLCISDGPISSLFV